MRSKKPRRSSQLRRKQALNPGKRLGRRSPLGGASGLRSAPLAAGKPGGGGKPGTSFVRLPASWRPAWLAWKTAVTETGVCVACGRGPKATGAQRAALALDPHHLLAARFLRAYARSRRKEMDDEQWEALLKRILFDPRNGVALCRGCHEAHENRSRPLSRGVLTEAAWEFAGELGMEWRLEGSYL